MNNVLCSTRCRSAVAVFLVAVSLAPPARGGAPLAIDAVTNPDKWPVIPIPEIATDPNSGTTLGVFPIVLFTNAEHEVRNILAPDVNYNAALGAGAAMRFFSYPSADTQWFALAGGSERVARLVDLDYATGLARRRAFSLEGHFFFEREPSQRFFGLGNDSRFRDQTNYTSEQVFGDGLVAYNVSPAFQIGLEGRPRYQRIHRGVYRNLPFTAARFPDLRGLSGGTELLSRIVLAYDTRDSLSIPTAGGAVAAFAGISERTVGSSFSYTEFGFQAVRYVPLARGVTLASHAYMRYVIGGGDLPFWAMSRLGGENAGETSAFGVPLDTNQQTYRGSGAGRFVDRDVLVANVELRTRVYERDLFGTHWILEPAPFVDAGHVFRSIGDNPLDVTRFHPAAGIGLRGIAFPFVVGYVDVGWGATGLAVFSGINYPF